MGSEMCIRDRFYAWKNRGPQWEALLTAYSKQLEMDAVKETAEQVSEDTLTEVEEAA